MGRSFGGRYGRSEASSSGYYSSYARNSQPVNAPVEMGKEYEVEITSVSNRGDGVAKVQGFVVFVQGGKPGPEKVKVRIERVSARFANASMVGGQRQSEEEGEGGGGEEEGEGARGESEASTEDEGRTGERREGAASENSDDEDDDDSQRQENGGLDHLYEKS